MQAALSIRVHAHYGNTVAVFDILSGELVEGSFPPRQHRLKSAWLELRLEYVDGQVRLFDLEPLLDRGLYRDLREPSMVASVHPDLDTVAWAHGIDVDPERLYEDSVPLLVCRTLL